MTALEAIFGRLAGQAPAMALTSARERRDRLQRLRRSIVARRVEVAAAIHADFGRPSFESELSEIHHVIAEIDHALRRLPRWMKGERAAVSALLLGTSSRVRYEARGVVLIMAPWNYPFGLLMAPLVAAIAAGNCVMLKPSEKTPHTSALLADLVRTSCHPDEVALVEGGADVAAAMLELPFDHFFFTGSTQVGRIVMAAAARHLATVTLELGGKSPAIVDAGVDVGRAAERIVWGKFFNAGQTCVAPDYVLVHRSQEQAFLVAALAALQQQYGSSEAEREASPDFARIVDDGHLQRLRGLIKRSVEAGAVMVAGGPWDEATRYLAPTILSRVTPEMAVMREEIFGPILPVMVFDSIDEVVASIRAGGKPLAMYLFADRANAERVVAGTSAGATILGNTLLHYGSSTLPFGGVGASGVGAYHGVHGFRAFSHARAMVRQHEPALSRFFLPPYRGWKHTMVRRVLAMLE